MSLGTEGSISISVGRASGESEVSCIDHPRVNSISFNLSKWYFRESAACALYRPRAFMPRPRCLHMAAMWSRRSCPSTEGALRVNIVCDTVCCMRTHSAEVTPRPNDGSNTKCELHAVGMERLCFIIDAIFASIRRVSVWVTGIALK